MLHPLKITSTLADETRFQIYEYMLQQKRSFTVQEIAEKFNIHPNVARLHLTKLTEIDVVSADFVKTGKGGRPARIYKATEHGVDLSFPKREDSYLVKWAIELIEEMGPRALEVAKRISYEDGYNKMKTRLNKVSPSITFDEKLEILSDAALLIGYIPRFVETDKGKKVILTIYNCPFRDQLTTHHEIICDLHKSYLSGKVDALFGSNDIIQFESMAHDCDFCKYEIKIPNIAL